MFASALFLWHIPEFLIVARAVADLAVRNVRRRRETGGSEAAASIGWGFAPCGGI